LSEDQEFKRQLRNMHIGLAVCVAIYAIGFVLFYDDGTAIQVVTGVGFVACLGVFFGLDARDQARHDRTTRSR